MKTTFITRIEVIEVDLETVARDGGTLDNLEVAEGFAVHNRVFGRVFAGLHDAAFMAGADPSLWELEGNEVVTGIRTQEKKIREWTRQ